MRISTLLHGSFLPMPIYHLYGTTQKQQAACNFTFKELQVQDLRSSPYALIRLKSIFKLNRNLQHWESLTWSIAQGIRQRRSSFPEKRCGNELGNDGTAYTNTKWNILDHFLGYPIHFRKLIKSNYQNMEFCGGQAT